MKKKIFTVLVALAGLLSLTSCEGIIEGRIVDWSPVSLQIKVKDTSGNDLLDPDNPANVIDGTSITFKGETFEASREWYDASIQTKAYFAQLYGLLLTQENTGSEDFVLYFGEIDGASDMDEDLVITWPDGTQDTIHYHCSDHNERKISCDRSWKLNGRAHESGTFVFTKYSN